MYESLPCAATALCRPLIHSSVRPCRRAIFAPSSSRAMSDLAGVRERDGLRRLREQRCGAAEGKGEERNACPETHGLISCYVHRRTAETLARVHSSAT
jgi:hypothetical protein